MQAGRVMMMIIAAKKAAQLRILASQCRGWAGEMESPAYAAKMWRAAIDLEAEAQRLEAAVQAEPHLSALTEHHPHPKPAPADHIFG